MNEKRTAILISGMHRGGTSSVASVVHMLGASLPGHLLPVQPDNPRGFFESERIMTFNDRIFSESGTSWSDWRSINNVGSGGPLVEKYLAEATSIIADEYGNNDFIVLKDPRISKILPLWIRALEKSHYRVCNIVPVRHPAEVSASLLKRNAIPESLSRLSWVRHFVDVEHYSRDQSRIFILWSEFINDWEREAVRIANHFEIGWPQLTDPVRHKIATLLSPELWHHRAAEDPGAGRETQNDYVDETYAVLKVLVSEPSSQSASRRFDSIRNDFLRTERIYGPAFAAMETARNRADSDRDALAAELSRARIHIPALMRERDSALDNGSSLTMELLQTGSRLQASEAARERAGREQIARALEMQRTESLVEDLERRLQKSQKRLAATEGYLSEIRNMGLLRKVTTLLINSGRYLDARTTADPLIDEVRVDRQLGDTDPPAATLGLRGLLGLNGVQFVVGAYGRLLMRVPDDGGMSFYLSGLLRGVPKIEILGELAASKEARKAGTHIPGLSLALCKHNLSKWPIFGLVVRCFSTVEGNSPAERRLRAMEQTLYVRHH